jgi:hypothetical protein
MLDLLAVSDLVREKTSESFVTEATTKPVRRRSLQRRRAIRFRSAAVLRGLADRIEPSRTDPVAG